jgi:flagellar assembly factor FliW
MQVQSTRFGSFEVEESRALNFSQGLLGFPDSTTYVAIEVEDTPYLWLQSVEEEDVAFLATSPFLFFPNYDLELGDEEQQALEVEDPEQVEVLALLTVHRTGDKAENITANLLGPIVVNIESRRAMQLVLDSPQHSTRVPLVA